jgi:two-component sensor histidine kinase
MSNSLRENDRGRLLDHIINSLLYPVFFRNADLRIERYNGEAITLMGNGSIDILGRKIDEVAPEPMARAIAAADDEILSGRSSREIRLFNFDAENVCLINDSAIKDDNGNFEGLLTVFENVSTMARAEDELKRVSKVKDSILAISASLLNLEGSSQLFDLILEKVLAAIEHADVGCVLLLGEENMLHIASAQGYLKDETSTFSVRLEDTFQWKKSGGRLDDTLIINDLDSFMRNFDVTTTILNDEGGRRIKSSMSAPLFVDGNFLGLINLDSRRNNVFDETDRALVEYVRFQVPIVFGMFKAHERIKELLSEKAIMLREVHHRIKNNMSTVYSILSLQCSMVQDPSAKLSLEDAASRVQAMMTLYDSLYLTESYVVTNVAAFLPRLVDDIIKVFNPTIPLVVEKSIDNFTLRQNQLQPLCIIINEILTNSMKYAFVGRERGTISLVVSQSNKYAHIELGDDGIGLPPSIDVGMSGGFGLMLIKNFTSQLGGEVTIERGEGTRYLLGFPI